MKFLKIIGCAFLIASIGYFAMQSYKRSNIKKRIETLHNPSKKIGDTEEGIYVTSETNGKPIPLPLSILSDRDLQIWVDANIVPILNNVEHDQDETTSRQVSAGKIFSSLNDDKIRINAADREYALANSASDPSTFDLYKKIAIIISKFIDDLKGKLDMPTNAQYTAALKGIGSKQNPLPYETKIINTLKYAIGFCTVLLGQLQGAIDAKQISETTKSVIAIKQLIETTRAKARDFAFNYFGLSFS